MSSSSKKRKIVDERRVFQEKWEELYFVTVVGDVSHCLICQKSVAVIKEYYMRQHYETMHKDKYDRYKGKVRKEKLKHMKSSLCKQISMRANINLSNKKAVRANLALSEMIANSSRPFTEALFINECLLKASDICPNQKKLFEGISLSPNTVATRFTELAADVEKQLLATAKNFEAFQIALDESTYVSGSAQCALFIRGVDCNLNVTDEFLELIPLKSATTGRDVFLPLENCMKKHDWPWDKLACLATDGAPAMCSTNKGVVGLLKKKLNSLEANEINFIRVHCILHEEVLCSKCLQMKEVMDLVVKTVNFI